MYHLCGLARLQDHFFSVTGWRRCERGSYSATCRVTSCSLHHRMTSSLGRSVVIMSIRVESADCAEVGGAEFAAVHGDDDASGACDDGCLIWASATSTTVMPSSVSPLAPMNAMSTLNRRCVGFEFVHEGCGRVPPRWRQRSPPTGAAGQADVIR